MNTINSLHLAGEYSFDIIWSEKGTVFRERITVRFEEQIMSKEKYSCIYLRQMEAIFYLYSNMAWRPSGQNCNFLKFPKYLNTENTTKYRNLSWKPWSHVRISIYRTCPIKNCKREDPILGGPVNFSHLPLDLWGWVDPTTRLKQWNIFTLYRPGCSYPSTGNFNQFVPRRVFICLLCLCTAKLFFLVCFMMLFFSLFKIHRKCALI